MSSSIAPNSDENIAPRSTSPTSDHETEQFLSLPSSSSNPPPRAQSPNGSSGANKFYSKHSSKPFARSAAKRASVMTLPSIEYLQHQYVKLGIRDSSRLAVSAEANRVGQAADSTSGTTKLFGSKRLSPGPLKLISQSQQGLSQLTEEDLPPSPERPELDVSVPWEPGRSVKGQKALRNEVKERVKAVCTNWHLDAPPSLAASRLKRSSLGLPSDEPHEPISRSSTPAPASDENRNLIPHLLHSTTSAIRSVQRYVVSLPTPPASSPSVTPEARTPSQTHFLNVSTTSRPRISVLTFPPSPSRLVTPIRSPMLSNEPLSALRKASLDVLGALHELETRYRLTSPLFVTEPESNEAVAVAAPASEEEEPSLSAGSGTSSPLTSEMNANYVEGIGMDELGEQRALVKVWVEKLDEILGQGTRTVSGQRSVSTRSDDGLPEEPRDDDEELEEGVPTWAKEDVNDLNAMERAYEILSCSLAPDLLDGLPPVPSNTTLDARTNAWRAAFLNTLSDAHLLLLAFNSVVRSSNRPFGFVPLSLTHSFPIPTAEANRRASLELSSEAGSTSGKVGELYRRIENLRWWIGAIKFRYNLDLTKTGFDAKVVARKGPGWEGMLQKGLWEWVEVVVKEARMSAEEGEAI